MAEILLEVCVDDVAGLQAAVAGGADRIELCQNLGVGGLTPSSGLMMAARDCGVPLHAMIRPRTGGFVYSDAELGVMLGDIAAARQHGLHGVVFGALDDAGNLHEVLLRRLLKASEGMSVTLHRAFDVATAPIRETVEQAIALGFDRILTSGRAALAQDGIVNLRESIAQARGRISIMPASGLNPEMIAAFLRHVTVQEVHASCTVPVQLTNTGFDFTTAAARHTDQAQVARMKVALRLS